MTERLSQSIFTIEVDRKPYLPFNLESTLRRRRSSPMSLFWTSYAWRARRAYLS
jgi:hypothetical protein